MKDGSADIDYPQADDSMKAKVEDTTTVKTILCQLDAGTYYLNWNDEIRIVVMEIYKDKE